MAHEYAMKCIGNPNVSVKTNNEIIAFAWQYADAMQAEADKRSKAEAEQKRKAVREMLNADNTFLEKEGQHFDDVANQKRTPKVSRFERSDAVREVLSRAENMGLIKPKADKDWQPDWIQAPEWANWWCLSVMHGAMWFSREPICTKSTWAMLNDVKFCAASFDEAPPFNYQGNWQDSLRKRPQ